MEVREGGPYEHNIVPRPCADSLFLVFQLELARYLHRFTLLPWYVYVYVCTWLKG